MIARTTDKYIQGTPTDYDKCSLAEIVTAALAAVGLTCRDKVIKVFNQSLSLFVLITQSQKVESDRITMARMLS